MEVEVKDLTLSTNKLGNDYTITITAGNEIPTCFDVTLSREEIITLLKALSEEVQFEPSEYRVLNTMDFEVKTAFNMLKLYFLDKENSSKDGLVYLDKKQGIKLCSEILKGYNELEH